MCSPPDNTGVSTRPGRVPQPFSCLLCVRTVGLVNDRGSTLLELSGASAVLAALSALAVGSFRGTPNDAYDAQVRANLRTATVAVMSSEPSIGSLQAAEPALAFTTGPSLDSAHISVTFAGGNVGLAARSGSDRCFLISIDPLTQPSQRSVFSDQCRGDLALG